MASRDGNGWVRCALGHRHWGRFGAAGLLAYVPAAGRDQPPGTAAAGSVLLQHRTWWSHHGGTWGLPGGARDSHESPVDAAFREAAEECGVPAGAARPRGIFTDDHGGWSYTTVLAEAAAPFAVLSDDHESDEVAWVAAPDVGGFSLHPGFGLHWPRLAGELSTVTIIVDGANVVGSRPDGWWRDRAGAAVRLRGELEPLAADGIGELPDGMRTADGVRMADGMGTADGSPSRSGLDSAAEAGALAQQGTDGRARLSMRWLPDVVLVVEGAARSAATRWTATGVSGPAGTAAGQVRMVAATGSGDDTIAALAGQTAGRRIVVTADRELRQRCLAVGASVAGPSWLLGLPRLGPPVGSRRPGSPWQESP
jgi:8-oxo-dGTP diphosphatase